jgi:hypothetical protein
MGMTGRADRFVWIALKLHFVPLFRRNDSGTFGRIFVVKIVVPVKAVMASQIEQRMPK